MFFLINGLLQSNCFQMFCSKHSITFENTHLLSCWFHYVDIFYISLRMDELLIKYTGSTLNFIKSFADVNVVMTKLFSIYLDLRLHFMKQNYRLLMMEIWHVSLLAASCLPDCLRYVFSEKIDISRKKHNYVFLMYLVRKTYLPGIYWMWNAKYLLSLPTMMARKG